MSTKILFVDDDANILTAYQRVLRRDFALETAEGAALGLTAIETNGPYAVVVSDMRMPGMDGVQFLSRVREMAPDTIRIMLTGNTDQETAMSAVNQGSIFRFLTKPCPAEEMGATLKLGLEQYRLIRAERELLEQTLGGAVKVLVDTLSLVNPAAFGCASRAKNYVLHMAGVLGIKDIWLLDLATQLCKLGCLTLSPDLVARAQDGEPLTPEEEKEVRGQYGASAQLVGSIPRLEKIAAIFDRLGGKTDNTDAQVVQGAEMLRTALDVDVRIQSGQDLKECLHEMRRVRPPYDESLLKAMETAQVILAEKVSRSVTVGELAVGMTIDQDVKTSTGALLIARGQDVSASAILCLRNQAQRLGVVEPIRVLVPPGLRSSRLHRAA